MVDQEIQKQLQEPDCYLEKQTRQKNPLINLQNDVTESCTSADELLEDISFRDVLPLDEWRVSPCPSSVEEEEETKKRQVMTKSLISNNISSIILNLKVSQVLLQEAESSLALTESRMMANLCSNKLSIDEPDACIGQKESQVMLLKAVGPPSSRYIPRMEPPETEEFCSAGEESLENSRVLN